MKKRMTIMITALAVVFGGIVAYNMIKGYLIKRFFATYVPPAVTVSAITAKQQHWSPMIHAVGNFVARNGVDVNSQASGIVVGIHFNSGQYVEQGTPLIDIDDSIDQATLKSNQSELALQELNYQRQTNLFKHGATPGSSVDEARAKLLQAQANVEKSEASIRQKHISTPFTGRLGIRQVNLGQYITPGQTAIVALQSLDPLYLQFYVPEQLYKQLHINQPITFSLEQNPNILFEGKLSALNSHVDTNTHNIEIQATLPNCPAAALTDPTHSPLVTVKKRPDDQKLIIACNSDLNTKSKITQFNFIPGMFATIEIPEPLKPNVIALPTTAISYSLYGNSVYVIEPDKDNKDILVVKRKFVTTGDKEGNYTVIKKGVKAGELIVSSGELKLQEGTRVVIDNSTLLTDTEDALKLNE